MGKGDRECALGRGERTFPSGDQATLLTLIACDTKVVDNDWDSRSKMNICPVSEDMARWLPFGDCEVNQ